VDSPGNNVRQTLVPRGFGLWCRDGGSNPDDPKVGGFESAISGKITSRSLRSLSLKGAPNWGPVTGVSAGNPTARTAWENSSAIRQAQYFE
jgi:hypothetical protein